MNCPHCDFSKSKILHTEKYPSKVRRVRVCQRCVGVWRTFEDGFACSRCGALDVDVEAVLKYDATIMRRRKCSGCGYFWKTAEVLLDNYDF